MTPEGNLGNLFFWHFSARTFSGRIVDKRNHPQMAIFQTQPVVYSGLVSDCSWPKPLPSIASVPGRLEEMIS